MRRAGFTELQIVSVLKQVTGGRSVKEVCGEIGVSENTYKAVEKLPICVPTRMHKSVFFQQPENGEE